MNLNLRRGGRFCTLCSPQPTASTNSKCSPASQPAALSSRSPALLQPEDLSRGTQVQYGTLEAHGEWGVAAVHGGGGVNQGRRRSLLVPVRVCGACACVLLSPVPNAQQTRTHTRRGMGRGMRRGIDAWRAATVHRRPTCTNTHACAALALPPQRATQY